MKILILGGTGFLGKYLVRELAPHALKITIITRNINSVVFAQYPNVELVAGDITEAEVFYDLTLKKKVLDECDIVIHAAALYDLKATFENCYLQNVVGTQNVIHLLKRATNIKAFYYISTIAVVVLNNNFTDHYSKTKFIAENIVSDFSAKNASLPVRIIRPGVIVGDSKTGFIETLNGPYYFLEFIKKFRILLEKIPVFPLSYNPKTRLHLIPVDHVANLLSLLIKRDRFCQDIKTYHLICIDPPTISDFIQDMTNLIGLKTKFIPIKDHKLINFLVMPCLNIPKEVIPFMFSQVSYDMSDTLKDLPEIKNSKYADFKKIFF